jgi:hypothetical protein
MQHPDTAFVSFGSVAAAKPCLRWRQLSPKAVMAALDNMRANGVRSLDVCCWQCHHRAILSADPWPDHVPGITKRLLIGLALRNAA